MLVKVFFKTTLSSVDLTSTGLAINATGPLLDSHVDERTVVQPVSCFISIGTVNIFCSIQREYFTLI